MSDKKIHHGRNIKRFREMLGIKQEALAISLGDDWNQKRVSQLETKEVVEPSILQQVSDILKIPVAAIENLDDDGAINIIANTFQDGAVANNSGYFNCTFNPLDKMAELYERMIHQQAEMIEKLERLIKEK